MVETETVVIVAVEVESEDIGNEWSETGDEVSSSWSCGAAEDQVFSVRCFSCSF
jgi:hypothetical protein